MFQSLRINIQTTIKKQLHYNYEIHGIWAQKQDAELLLVIHIMHIRRGDFSV